MSGNHYSNSPNKYFLLFLLILVLVSSTACRGSDDNKVREPGYIRSGLITVMDNPPEITPYPYQIDFSELNTTYYDGTKDITVNEPDLLINMTTLQAPNGIKDRGRILRIFCYNPPFDLPIYGTDPQPIVNKYRLRYYLFSLRAPAIGYRTDLKLWRCHRYYVKTEEGETVLLIHIGLYIGGINRQHFFWSYVGI